MDVSIQFTSKINALILPWVDGNDGSKIFTFLFWPWWFFCAMRVSVLKNAFYNKSSALANAFYNKSYVLNTSNLQLMYLERIQY